ncbi:MAG: CinA family nicotinamide mononucleotide deamidase-related protein [Bacteroidota bacterium]
MIRISFVTIGSELLKGRIVNTNTTEVGKLLRKHGFDLSRNVTIPDTKEAILEAVESELANHEVVLMSGGLGPTKDDITKYTLGEYFGGEMVENERTLDHLKHIFEIRGRKLTDRNRLQALVPESCEVLFNAKGTAPGMLFRKDGHMLASMPGVPFELMYLMEHEMIPRMKEAFSGGIYLHEIIRITGIPESHAADRMEQVERKLPPKVSIAYLPRLDGIWLEMSMSSLREEEVRARQDLKAAADIIEVLFQDKAYARGEAPLPEIAVNRLKENKLTIAVAESLTGGLVASKLVSVSGASEVFKGSVTAYDTQVKIDHLKVPPQTVETHTVVSGEVAQAMAEGVRNLLGADIGLATTGRAEKEGDHRPEVYLGYADEHGSTARRADLFNDRNINRERAANYLLHLLLRKLSTDD